MLICCSASDVCLGSHHSQPTNQNTLSQDFGLSPKPQVSINPGATHNAPEFPEIAWPSPEIGSAFDATADFAWLFSSRLPTVQTGGSSDTSPNEGASGISPTVRQGDRGAAGGRIVKVTWWRPHAQTAIAPGKRAAEAIVLGAQGHRTQAHDADGSTGRHTEPWECSAGSVVSTALTSPS
jgi:hypothetical protein